MEFIPVVFFLIFVAFIALVVIGILYGKKQEEERRRALAALAAEHGLDFTLDDPVGLPARLGSIGPFNDGHDPEASNVMIGDCGGIKLVLFDYKYTTTETSTDSKGRTTTRDVDHHLSACIHALEGPYPDLLIRHEGFGDKVAGFFGAEDVDFESDEFSRTFYVKGADRKFAYDICHPRMMEWLLANPGWHVEMTDGLFVLRTEDRWKPEEFRAAIDFATRFFALIPDFVRREYQERAGAQGA